MIAFEPRPLVRLLKRPATYGIVKAGAFQRTGVPMVRGGDVKPGRILSDLPRVSKSKSDEYSRTILRAGDVVVALVGYPGNSAVVPPELAGANISRAVGLLRPGPLVEPSFLAHYLNSPRGRREFLKPSAGSAQLVVNLSDLNKLELPLLPMDDQRTIAEALSTFDEMIDLLERKLAKKQAIKQGMMQQLLIGKTRLPGFTQPWREVCLGDVLTVRHGKSQRAVESPRGLYPILATGGQIGWAKAPLYSKPSVLIGRKGTIDRPQYMASPFWTVDTLFYTEVEASTDPRYLYYVFLTIDWRSMNEASGVPSLSASRVESVEIRLPRLDEQRAIREVLDDAGAEIDMLKRRLTKAKAIKTGVMQELLTGRTRIPVAEGAA